MGCGCTQAGTTLAPVLSKADENGGVAVVERKQEPPAVSPSSLRTFSGSRSGFGGKALTPKEREDDEKTKAAMLERASTRRVANSKAHAATAAAALRHRINAAMCATCPGVSADGVTCTALNLPVATVLTISVDRGQRELKQAVACPLGRHARGSRNLVRWRGVLWYGVPEPLRWVIDWRLVTQAGRKPVASTLGGCGCVVALKRLAQRPAFAWLNQLERIPGLRLDFAKRLLDQRTRAARMGAWSSIAYSLRSSFRFSRLRDVPSRKSSARSASSP